MSYTEDDLDKILAIARSRPEGIHVEVLKQHGFTELDLVYSALHELERRGKLTARHLIYPDPPR